MESDINPEQYKDKLIPRNKSIYVNKIQKINHMFIAINGKKTNLTKFNIISGQKFSASKEDIQPNLSIKKT